MTEPAGVETAKFLAHSPHRIELLRALRDGPRTRGALTERAGVSRVTVGRSLGEMETRKWVARADGQYLLRPLGEAVVEATEAYLRTLSTARRLRDVADYLAVDELGFDLDRLADATVVQATRHDNDAVTRRYLDLLAGTAELRVLKDTVDVAVATAISDRIAAGELDVCVVYSAEAIATTREIPEARDLMVRDLSNGKRAFQYPGRLAHHVAVLDATVLFFLRDDRGVRGLVETDDPVVRDWAVETFERVREGSTRVDASTVSAEK